MSNEDHRDDSDSIEEYRGLPNKPLRQGEKSLWQRFLEFLIPSLKTKWAQAERLAEAKLHQEAGKALQEEGKGRQEMAKAREMEQRARRIADMAHQKEAELLEDADPSTDDEEDLQEEIEKLQQDLKRLKLKHGTQLELSVERLVDFRDHELVQEHPKVAPYIEEGWQVWDAGVEAAHEGTKLVVVLGRAQASGGDEDP